MFAARNVATRFANEYGAVIQLDASPGLVANDVDVPKLKWIHCANVGVYKGHHQGEFEFTQELFEGFVRNFRRDPRYRQQNVFEAPAGTELLSDASGPAGSSAVLQFDYEHASEMPPWEGSIPQFGAPAPAWVFDVEVRIHKGKCSLWALADLGDVIRGQIKRKEYKFVSIAFASEAKDWETGAPIGPALTSIAFTNQPFMRDLEPLAARRSLPTTRASNGDHMSKTVEQLTADLENITKTLTNFRQRLCKLLRINNLLDDDAIAGAVDEAVSKGSSLGSLLETLGVKDGADAIKAVAALQEARAELSERLAEIDAALNGAMKTDEAAVEQDVTAAMSAAGLTRESTRVAFTAQRKSYVAEENAKAQAKLKPGQKLSLAQGMQALSDARARFLKDHGIEGKQPQQHPHLRQPVVAHRGSQLEPPVQTRSNRGPESVPLGEGDEIDVSLFDGRNTTERVMNYLASENPGFHKLTHSDKVRQASLFKRNHQVIDENASQVA